MEITVSNCQECKYIEENSGYNKDKCNHPKGDSVNKSITFLELLPFDTIHPLCPLKKESITISVNHVKE